MVLERQPLHLIYNNNQSFLLYRHWTGAYEKDSELILKIGIGVAATAAIGFALYKFFTRR